MLLRIAWSGAFAIAMMGCGRSSSTPPAQGSVAIDPPAAAGASAPNLAGSGDAVLATWLEPTAAGAHSLRFARYAGGAWSKPATITEGATIVANWADVPSIARQASGALVAHWAEKSPSPEAHAYDVVLARSIDDGASWRRLGSPHRDGTAAEHGFVSLVPDGDAVLALWLDGRALAGGATGATMLRAARVADTIGDEQIVDDRVCDCCSTSAAVTADGPLIAYRDRSGDELRDPAAARRAGGVWSAPGAIHADGWTITGCPVNGPAVAAAGREVATAWYTYAGQRHSVRVAFSADAGATFDPPIEIDGPRGTRTPIGRVDVALDRPGQAIVSWVAADRDDAQILVRRVARDRRRGRELAVAATTAVRASGFPRFELVRDDLVLAWTDTRKQTIRAVRLARSAVPAVAATGEP